jgi:hypothetical protein
MGDTGDTTEELEGAALELQGKLSKDRPEKMWIATRTRSRAGKKAVGQLEESLTRL